MHHARYGLSFKLLSLPFPKKTLSAFTGIALSLVIAATAFFPGSTASASNPSAPPSKSPSTTPFLTLPFEANASMSMLSGWYYSGGGGYHGGIDYIKGSVNNSRWATFAVIAAADGEACGNCTMRQGNAVWVKHNVNGTTYFTYYGHLASIAKEIPIGSQSRTLSVKRGQFLGWAGDTGARGALHLHFALYTSGSKALDPYGIHNLRQHYPNPTQGSPGVGWFLKDATSAAKEVPAKDEPIKPAPPVTLGPNGLP